jgi:hypothetical protein
MPYEIFLGIFDSLLESGYSEIGGRSWKDVFGNTPNKKTKEGTADNTD